MDSLRLMVLTLLISATVSTSGVEAPPQTVTAVPSPTYAAVETAEPLPTFAPSEVPVMVFETLAPTIPPEGTTPRPTEPVTAASAPTSAPSGGGDASRSSGPRDLAKGSKGSDVRMLQQLLKDLGYDVTVDGAYGDRTREAVKAFQKNNGLKADGIAGTRTIRKLTSDSAVPATGGSERTSLSYGMSGQDVIDLQSRLTTLGYYSDVLSGNYLNMTRDAVRWFQQMNSLSVDGVAGPATLSRLYSQSAVPASLRPAATQTPATGGFARTLREGMSGDDVRLLQQRLMDYGYFSGTITGYFGTVTLQAVQSFQGYNSLYADGVVGNATQKKLLSGNAVPCPDDRPSGGQAVSILCRNCGQIYPESQHGNHLNAGCAHYVCQGQTHPVCLRCGLPSCEVGAMCPSNLGGGCWYQ